ncbi:MAG: putative toxin-antitoxin system toxin component, PIN family [Paludibacteraceae bacterium]|nr:putative toxin-antitoxin system toxin component, PIN family [Paludibacteraceae bacterium]
MIYVVIDTNVFVSAYMTHNLNSATYKVVEHLLNGKIQLLYNNEIMAEYEDVLSRPYLRINPIERDTLFDFIRNNGVLTDRTSFYELFVDEDDRVFYEVMLSEEDSFLVTGNLKHFPISPRVVTPAQMLQIIAGE